MDTSLTRVERGWVGERYADCTIVPLTREKIRNAAGYFWKPMCVPGA
jgi:hypothetical protein